MPVEPTVVARLQFRVFPIVLGNDVAAERTAAAAFQGPMCRTFRIAVHNHGVIAGDFLAGLDVTHGHQDNLSLPPGIWLTRVVHVMLRHERNFRSGARPDGMPLGNLDGQVGALGR